MSGSAADRGSDLVGASVVLAVSEPFELIADGPLRVRARIAAVEVIGGISHLILRIIPPADPSRLGAATTIAAAARSAGDSILTLAPAADVRVHGEIYEDDARSIRVSGFIGRIELDDQL